MSSELPWETISTFLAVMREGSLSGAARAQGLAQPTARRRIEALERSLGAVLFTRSANGLEPTETARRTLPHAASMEAAAHALGRTAGSSDDAVRGTVRVTASEVVAAEVLPAVLGALLEAHPALAVELSPSDRNEDLLRRDADVAVRMARPTQAALVATRVGEVELGLFASAAYLERHPAPKSVRALRERHVLIANDRAPGLIEGVRASGVEIDRTDARFRCDHDLAQLAAVRAGLGVGMCQAPLAARDGLRRVLPSLSIALPVWVAMHEDLRASERVRRVFRHLADGLARYLS